MAETEERPDWMDAQAEPGIPNWAVLQAFDEASDLDTVAEIKARASEIAADPSS